jgi:hypothetical protein
MMVAGVPARSISNICLKLKNQLTTGCNDIAGCSFLTGGKRVFINFCPAFLLILNVDGSQERKVSLLTRNALDVACIDQNTAAVTSPSDQLIQLVDLNTGKTVKSINTNTTCCGITSTNGMLVFSVLGKGLSKVDLKDENIVEIVAFDANFLSRVTSINDRLYYTNSKRDEVVCCHINGTIFWTFTYESVLKTPRAITVDEYGHVYVVGANSTNVIVISSNGKEHRTLLSTAGILDKPRALHYDRKTRQLLVANNKTSAFIYSVDY